MIAPAIRQAQEKPGFLDGLREILARAEAEVARYNLTCRGCGKCCDFTRMEHRLYVSTGELALLQSLAPPRPGKRWKCPYQDNHKCLAHSRRPLGCRVFFCESSLPDDFYERFHSQIIELHRQFAVPYSYVELTEAMAGE